jgi:hypothetical protein
MTAIACDFARFIRRYCWKKWANWLLYSVPNPESLNTTVGFILVEDKLGFHMSKDAGTDFEIFAKLNNEIPKT